MKNSSKNIKKISAADIETAAASLEASDVLVYPTETCYGLGCLVTKPESVERIFEIKGRPQEKAFPIVFPNISVLQKYAVTDSEFFEPLTKKFWPGPLTLVLPATKLGSEIFASRPQTLAVRISSHPFLLELFSRLSVPLISTSANLAGCQPIETADAALRLFKNCGVGGIVDGGRLSASQASTILDLTSSPASIVREGSIPSKAIVKFLARTQ